MGHDIHFLERLERVEGPEVDLALTLYRDPKLVSVLVNSMKLAEGVQRAALALTSEERGPHVVVARDGHFVTCLGPGMSTGALPVLPRVKLGALMERVSDLRTGEAVAEEQGIRALLVRMFDGAHRMDRENFLDLLAINALSTPAGRLGRLLGTVMKLRLLRMKVVAEDPSCDIPRALENIWKGIFTVATGWVLATEGGEEEMSPLMAPLRKEGPRNIVWELATYGLRSTTLRVSWGVGRAGKPFLASMKTGLSPGGAWFGDVSCILGLLCIGLRRRTHRAEVRKFMERAMRVEFAPGHDPARYAQLSALRVAMQPALTELFDDPEAPTARALARAQAEVVRRGAGQPAGSPYRFDQPEQVPPELALSLAVNLPEPLLSTPAEVVEAVELLPWLAVQSPEALFLPRAAALALLPPWEPEHTLATQRLLEAHLPKTPIRAEATPGRNEPCACGSGKKSKRCCGG